MAKRKSSIPWWAWLVGLGVIAKSQQSGTATPQATPALPPTGTPPTGPQKGEGAIVAPPMQVDITPPDPDEPEPILDEPTPPPVLAVEPPRQDVKLPPAQSVIEPPQLEAKMPPPPDVPPNVIPFFPRIGKEFVIQPVITPLIVGTPDNPIPAEQPNSERAFNNDWPRSFGVYDRFHNMTPNPKGGDTVYDGAGNIVYNPADAAINPEDAEASRILQEEQRKAKADLAAAKKKATAKKNRARKAAESKASKSDKSNDVAKKAADLIKQSEATIAANAETIEFYYAELEYIEAILKGLSSLDWSNLDEPDKLIASDGKYKDLVAMKARKAFIGGEAARLSGENGNLYNKITELEKGQSKAIEMSFPIPKRRP